jgi:hypothetical protein
MISEYSDRLRLAKDMMIKGNIDLLFAYSNDKGVHGR